MHSTTGKYGSYHMIADVGTADTLKDLGVHHKRIPKWVLPDSIIAYHNQDPVNARDKLRPDIMVVELSRAEQASCASRPPNRQLDARLGNRARRVWILKGGYCSDTMYHEKLQEKTQQHQALVNMLTSYGYDVHLLPFPLGLAGTIYKSNCDALQDLGLGRSSSLTTLRKLHVHAIKCLHNIIKARRYLERHTRLSRQNFRSRSEMRSGQG